MISFIAGIEKERSINLNFKIFKSISYIFSIFISFTRLVSQKGDESADQMNTITFIFFMFCHFDVLSAISVHVIFFIWQQTTFRIFMLKLEIKIQDLTEFSIKITECSPGPRVRQVVLTEQTKIWL